MKLAYMAHPLGPDGAEREKNRKNAAEWFGWLHEAFPHVAFTANWVLLSGVWPESDEYRRRGLEIDMVHVERADLIFYVGGKMSQGMLKEQSCARRSHKAEVNLLFMGYGAPAADWLSKDSLVRGFIKELDSAIFRYGSSELSMRARELEEP